MYTSYKIYINNLDSPNNVTNLCHDKHFLSKKTCINASQIKIMDFLYIKLLKKFHITYASGDGNLAASKCVLFSTLEITPATLLCAKISTISPAFN